MTHLTRIAAATSLAVLTALAAAAPLAHAGAGQRAARQRRGRTTFAALVHTDPAGTTKIQSGRYTIESFATPWTGGEGFHIFHGGVARTVHDHARGVVTVQFADGTRSVVTGRGAGDLAAPPRQARSFAAEQARRLQPPQVEPPRVGALAGASNVRGMMLEVHSSASEHTGLARGWLAVQGDAAAAGFVSVKLPDRAKRAIAYVEQGAGPWAAAKAIAIAIRDAGLEARILPYQGGYRVIVAELP